MLSKKAIRFLNDNEYQFKENEESFIFKNVGIDRMIMSGCGTTIFTIIIILPLTFLVSNQLITNKTLANAVTVVVTLGAAINIFKFMFGGMSKKSVLTIYPKKYCIQLRKNDSTEKIHFTEMVELNYHSKFVSEYASAHKKTSQEFKQTILLRIANGRNVELFQCKGDYLEPSEEFMEVHDLLKNTFKC